LEYQLNYFYYRSYLHICAIFKYPNHYNFYHSYTVEYFANCPTSQPDLYTAKIYYNLIVYTIFYYYDSYYLYHINFNYNFDFFIVIEDKLAVNIFVYFILLFHY